MKSTPARTSLVAEALPPRRRGCRAAGRTDSTVAVGAHRARGEEQPAARGGGGTPSGCRRCSPSPRAAPRRRGRSESRRARSPARGMAPSRRRRAGPVPRSPPSSSLCTEPGRSTSTMRAASAARAAGASPPSATSWPSWTHWPSARSASAATSRPERSPATTTVMPLRADVAARGSPRCPARVDAPRPSRAVPAAGPRGAVGVVEERRDELAGGALRRQGPLLLDLGEPGLDGGGRPRPAGTPARRGPGAAGRAPLRDGAWARRGRRPGRLAHDRRPERDPLALQQLCELLGRVLGGALVEQPRHDRRDALDARAARRTAGGAARCAPRRRTGRGCRRPPARCRWRSVCRCGSGNAHGLRRDDVGARRRRAASACSCRRLLRRRGGRRPHGCAGAATGRRRPGPARA